MRKAKKESVTATAERVHKRKEADVNEMSTFLPGTHTIYVKTWGCSHNNSDSEYMAGYVDESVVCTRSFFCEIDTNEHS